MDCGHIALEQWASASVFEELREAQEGYSSWDTSAPSVCSIRVLIGASNGSSLGPNALAQFYWRKMNVEASRVDIFVTGKERDIIEIDPSSLSRVQRW